MKRFFTLLGAMSPSTKLVRDDGSFILSTEDIQRRRMVFVSSFGLVMTVMYTILQVVLLGFDSTGLFNVATGVVGAAICGLGLRFSLFGERPQPMIRILLLAFSVLIWGEIAFSGGITGYHVGILPVLPVIAAILLSARDTILFTTLNLLVVLGISGLAYSGSYLPDFAIVPETDLMMSSFMIILAILGCGGAAVTLVLQSEKVNRQLMELVEYQSHLAAHDALSGLGNRIRLQQRFDALKSGETFDILLIDLDGFKAVNDTFGHNAGDYLIKALSERLREVTDEEDLLVRLGGDEFVILLENVDGTLASIRKYAEYLIEILSRPYLWDKTVLRISASIGHARYPNHGSTPSKVLSLADKALYQAKDAGKRQCITYGSTPAPKPARKEHPLRA
ncbi:MAG: diguanylate cyclase [Hyphomonas sp.]|nr:diguanylate cyclase [Hyphomonas sp.]